MEGLVAALFLFGWVFTIFLIVRFIQFAKRNK